MNDTAALSTPMVSPKLLFVYDAGEGVSLWVDLLRFHGFQIATEHQPLKILETWNEINPDLLVWDIKVIEKDHLRIIRGMRGRCNAPIVLLLPYYHEEEILAYYQAGVDECIVNPVSPAVFVAKLRVWVKRTWGMPADSLRKVQNGRMSLDAENRALRMDGNRSIPLTTLEFRLLYLLMSQPGKVFKTARIVQNLWGSSGEGDRILLKNLVYRLRQKIEDDPARPQIIQTLRGVGYSFPEN